jgi:hypothetical protein
MSVLNKLACSLGRRDEVPNQELAEQIVADNDTTAVKELIENLSNKDKNIQSDCIKALYEIGERNAKLIAAYHKEFGQLLDSKNNRLVWGAMTALDAIAAENPKGVHGLLTKIMATADSGSVITRDHTVGVLVKLGVLKLYAADCIPLLLEQLAQCPNNQFPMYCEKSLAVINDSNRERFQKVMKARLDDLEKESQKKRIAKVLKKIGG